MMSSWMDNLRSWLQPGSGRAGRTPRGRARLRVEHLEVRDTPSITIGGPCGPNRTEVAVCGPCS